MIEITEQTLLLAFIICVSAIIAFLIIYYHVLRNRGGGSPEIVAVYHPQRTRDIQDLQPLTSQQIFISRKRRGELFQQRLEKIQTDYANGTVSEETYRKLDSEYRTALDRLKEEPDGPEQEKDDSLTTA